MDNFMNDYNLIYKIDWPRMAGLMESPALPTAANVLKIY